MAEESRSARDSDRLFALDWPGFAQKRVLGDVLRLFSLRHLWLKDGNEKAYSELTRARRAADPNIRGVARLLLSEMALDRQPRGSCVRTLQAIIQDPDGVGTQSALARTGR